MKKIAKNILLIAFMFMTVGVISTSCSKSDNNEAKEDSTDGPAVTEESRALSPLAGKQLGYFKLEELEQVRQQFGVEIDIDQYLNGLEAAMSKHQPMAYVSGLGLGAEIASQLTFLVDSGINLKADVIFNNIKSNINTEEKDLYTLQNQTREELHTLLNTIDGNHYKATPAQIDSLHILYGKGYGAFISALIVDNERGSQQKFDREQLFKGINKMLEKKYAKDYINGLFDGIKIAQDLTAFEQMNNVGLVYEDVFKELKKIVKAGKVDEEDLRNVNMEVESLVKKIQQKQMEKQEKELSEKPEAIQNVKTGEAYVEKLKKENAKAKTSESGLTYIIKNPGEGDRITDNDMVSVRYRGTHLDGKEFDSNDSVTFSPQGVVPGFSEGLKLLSKGGKATLYIPGKLGYGAQGAPQAGIGPNEMLVFDIEILDIIGK